MYCALYRKYRPRTFSDVIGQEHIVTTLKNEVQENKVSHAFLFTGSRGTGKTTCSKILAKAVNCPNQKDGNPCGECDVCKGIDNGSIVDVLEIDAASNNGVDNIRQLREEAIYPPAVAKYRVYIIDETHMLSTGAFNALLKIMEEPPQHVIFILATTEVHKVPATIISRCQRFDFKRVSDEVIADRLKFICNAENVLIDDDAATLIAKASDGGVRDALSLLDLSISNSKGKVDVDVVNHTAGLTSKDYLFDIIEAVAEKNSAKALEIVDNLNKNSVNLSRLLEELLDLFRNIMIIKSSEKAEKMLLTSKTDLEKLKQLSTKIPISQVFYILNVLQNSLDRLTKVANRRVELEMAMVKLTNPMLDSSTEALVARIDELERMIKSGNITVSSQQNVVESATPVQANIPQPAPQKDEKPTPAQTSDVVEVECMFDDWAEVLDVLAKINPLLCGTLTNSTAYISGNRVLIEATELCFKLLRENQTAKESLKSAIKQVTGISYGIGPIKQETQVKLADDSLSELSKAAKALGINVTEI